MTSANPYRTAQDFMVAIGPADYFKEETDDEDEPEDGGFWRPRAPPTESKTPVKGEPTEAARAESRFNCVRSILGVGLA